MDTSWNSNKMEILLLNLSISFQYFWRCAGGYRFPVARSLKEYFILRYLKRRLDQYWPWGYESVTTELKKQLLQPFPMVFVRVFLDILFPYFKGLLASEGNSWVESRRSICRVDYF